MKCICRVQNNVKPFLQPKNLVPALLIKGVWLLSETQQVNQLDLREIYERTIGKRVSDVTWYKNRQLLEQNGIQCNHDTVKFLARLKKAGIRTNISLMATMQQYGKAQDLLNRTKQPLTGLQIKEYLTQYGIKPHQSTISAWFKDIGGYRRKQLYNPKDLVMLFTKAFIYKANTQQLDGES